jgi:hypothetical protein
MSKSSRKAKRDADAQREAIDLASRRLDVSFKLLMLRAGYVQLLLFVVLVAVAVALAATTVVSLVRGSYWLIPPAAGGSGILSSAASFIGRRLSALVRDLD